MFAKTRSSNYLGAGLELPINNYRPLHHLDSRVCNGTIQNIMHCKNDRILTRCDCVRSAVTCLAAAKDETAETLLLAGYASGHLRLYSASTRALLAEVCDYCTDKNVKK